MREIPSLQTLCLRNVGSKSCNAEDTFARLKNDQPSQASKLLRSSLQHSCLGALEQRTPAIGAGSARRKQANDVDLHHPWNAALLRREAENQDIRKSNSSLPTLYAQYNTPALDLLQSYIDSLVELSRMDDHRLGLHFFQEWKALVELKQSSYSDSSSSNNNSNKKKRRTMPLGSLSLYNTIIQQETVDAMVESKMTFHLAVLDLTGVQPLTDDLLDRIVTKAPQLRRLSVKDCRRLTHKSLECLSEYATELTSIDIGGAYNMRPHGVLEMVANLSKLEEIHASGLLWNDESLAQLTAMRSWKALSLGFLLASQVSTNGLKEALLTQTESLKSLALPFCEHLVDAALLGVLGRHLPHVETLDVRGNSQLNSLTGWYDGRATIHPMQEPLPLFVLARYSNITNNNIEETRRIHPIQAVDLKCCLDSDGVGEGIRRPLEEE